MHLQMVMDKLQLQRIFRKLAKEMETNDPLTNGSSENSKSDEANATDLPALTSRQAELIRETWDLVKVDLEGAGYILFTRGVKLHVICGMCRNLLVHG